MLFIYSGIQCNDLLTPSNGGVSCSSGREGVGYEGDTCSFTCNTGFELTGSDIRTCQSNGNWSGMATLCRKGIIEWYYFSSQIHTNNFTCTL